jgi:HlyD family secretion protein
MANTAVKSRRRLIATVATLIVVVGGAGAFVFRATMESKAAAAAKAAAPPPLLVALKGIGCFGRIEPEDGLIQVAAPYVSGQPGVVDEMKVQEGDDVQAGEVIAVLRGRAELAAVLAQNESRVAVSARRLEQVRAGAKPADVASLQADLSRARIQFEHAEQEYKRAAALGPQLIPVQDIEAKHTSYEDTRLQMESAQQKLTSLQQVRETDIRTAEAELESAMADRVLAQVQLDSTIVRSPVQARVLAINAHAGELPGSRGIVTLGKTDKMYVVAEVFHTDVGRVRTGQRAEIKSELLDTQLSGTVTRIGHFISRNELFSDDPGTFSDERIVRVWIKLDNGDPVRRMTHERVQVVINP